LQALDSYGYWGLFLAAFIAGSVVPFSAELIILALLHKGFPLWPLVLVATLGNWLGGYTAFFMGYYARWDLISKYFKWSKERVDNFKWVDKYRMELLAFFCWIPIFGSLILICLGLTRRSIFKTGLFMFLGRLIRYLLWALLSVEVLDAV
jgi:membrane protein YqaA with SNARE-associated domain